MLDKICVFMVMLCSGLKMNDNVINIIIVIEIGWVILCYKVNL